VTSPIHEVSAGAVVFFKSQAPQIEFLLLRSNFWGFPKGHIERGEEEQTAALREIREEAALDARLLGGFREVDEYTYSRRGLVVNKQTIYFLAQSSTQDTKLSHEHDDKIWLPFEAALVKLDYDGGRRILRRANEFLLEHRI
jgi:bis(5'-nucleosidyl)-tetraphosphatase